MPELLIQKDPGLERRKALALQMLQGGQTGPVRTGMEGLARLAKQLVGGYQMGQANKAEGERNRDLAQAAKMAYGEGGGGTEQYSQLLQTLAPESAGNLMVQQGQAREQEAKAAQRAEAGRETAYQDWERRQNYKNTHEGPGGLGNVSPKDYTAKSIEAFRETGNYSDLVRYRQPVKIGDVTYDVSDPKNPVPMVGMNTATDNAAQLAGGKEGGVQFARNREKFLATEPKIKAKIDSANAQAKLLADTIKELRPLLTAGTTSYGASLKSWPATEAKRVANLLITVKANVGLATLSDLKETSPTGASGFGALSAPELELIVSKLGSLDQYGEAKDLLRVLGNIEYSNGSAIERMNATYASERARYYGEGVPDGFKTIDGGNTTPGGYKIIEVK